MLIHFLCTFIFLLSTTAAELKLPAYLKKCKQDANLSKCLKENIEAAQKHILEGIPEVYIPPLNPLHLKDLKMETPQFLLHSPIFDAYGLNNFEVKDVNLNLAENSIQIKLFFPVLEARGTYIMKGSIILLTLEGSGDAYANVTNTLASVSMKGQREVKNGQEYINFKDDQTDLDIGGPNFLYFGNLFGAMEDLTKTINQAINENNDGFIAELIPFIKQATTVVMSRIIKLIFSKFSVDELFSK